MTPAQVRALGNARSLRSQWHHLAVRRVGRGDRQSDREVPPTAPAPGVPEVPRSCGCWNPTKEPAGQHPLQVLDNYADSQDAGGQAGGWRNCAAPEYHLHFIPTSSSWLNQVERGSSPRSPRSGDPRRGVFTQSVPALEQRDQRVPEATQHRSQTVRLGRRRRDAILDRIKEGLRTDFRFRSDQGSLVIKSVKSKVKTPAKLRFTTLSTLRLETS